MDFFERHPDWNSFSTVSCERRDKVLIEMSIKDLFDENVESEFSELCWTAWINIPDSKLYNVGFSGRIEIPEAKTMEQAVCWVDENYPMSNYSRRLKTLMVKYENEIAELKEARRQFIYTNDFEQKNLRMKIAKLLAIDPKVKDHEAE